MKAFYEISKLQNLMKGPACSENPENPTSIDLIFTNKLLSLKNTYVTAELSNFYKIIAAVTRIHFPKMKSQVVSYRKFKDFHNETFLDSFRHDLNIQGQFLNDAFSTICKQTFDNVYHDR